MVILAIETVTRGGSLALWVDGSLSGTAGDALHPHGSRLPVSLVSWLALHDKRLADVDLVAVTSGPGSFTGLRVGLATAQGLAMAGQKPVVGIPTLDAMVAAWQLDAGDVGLVAPCLDGQRGDVFFACFDTTSASAASDEWRTPIAPIASRPEAAAATLVAAAVGRPLTVTGDGALRYRGVFEAAGPDVRVAHTTRTIAEGAAWLAARHPERGGAPHALRPTYLRRPDAELARERASVPTPPSRGNAGWVVRQADGAADLAAVESIQAASFTSPWGADAFKWELEHSDVARLYVLAGGDGHIKAYCSCWMVADELHINSLAVAPDRRRQGMGRHLLGRLLAESAAGGLKAATLEVRASNAAARRLYETAGFVVEAVRRDYYQEPREDALVLWKRGSLVL